MPLMNKQVDMMNAVAATGGNVIPPIKPYELPSGPWANRVEWKLDATRSALLVHDMQIYFLRKFDMAQAPIPGLVRGVQALIETFRRAGAPVFYTAQPVRQDAADRVLLNDFWGPGLTAPGHAAEQPILDSVAPRPHETVLTKWRYSAFQRSDFGERLQALRRNQLVVCGVYAHIGCMATVLEAFMRDIQAYLVCDAVADFSLQEHRMACDYVSRRCGMVLDVAAVQAQLEAPPRGVA